MTADEADARIKAIGQRLDAGITKAGSATGKAFKTACTLGITALCFSMAATMIEAQQYFGLGLVGIGFAWCFAQDAFDAAPEWLEFSLLAITISCMVFLFATPLWALFPALPLPVWWLLSFVGFVIVVLIKNARAPVVTEAPERGDLNRLGTIAKAIRTNRRGKGIKTE